MKAPIRIEAKLGKIILVSNLTAFILIMALLCCSQVFRPAKADGIGAASYDCTGQDASNQIITVTTSATVTVILADADWTIAHTGVQDDGSTASVSTDYAVAMASKTSAGGSVTMDNTYADGAKIITPSGVPATFNATLIPAGPDGQHEIQIKANGHGCKMQLIRGRRPKD